MSKGWWKLKGKQRDAANTPQQRCPKKTLKVAKHPHVVKTKVEEEEEAQQLPESEAADLVVTGVEAVGHGGVKESKGIPGWIH